MNRHDRCSNLMPHQRGAALFMALIFLLILTILGVFGMNVSRLENLMAGNAQFQTTALNNAEYVLTRAERDLTTIETELYNGTGNNPFIGTVTDDAYYCANADSCLSATGDGTLIDPAALNWTFDSNLIELPDVNDDGTADGTGQYVIIDAGYDNASGECATQQCMLEHLAGAQVHVFLVTAQSESSRGAKRIVQSAFVTRPLPLVAPPTSESSSETTSDTTPDTTSDVTL
jgi:type IV pilus assembly protein PilX